jgi:sortase A
MTHKKVNYILAAVATFIALYIIAAPLLPGLAYWWGSRNGYAQPAYVSEALKFNKPSSTNAQGNRLVIPKIGIDEPILEGAYASVADKGLWHRPASSTPDKPGNTVIVGHRYSYKPGVAQAFYNLDKLEVGEKIVVAWGGKSYVYAVTEIKVVPPTAIEVEANTTDTRLTLYTCTPLWTAKDRLVVVAKPIGVNNE